MTAHRPLTQAWTCDGCGADWPCPARRRELRSEYAHAPLSLTVYLAIQLVDATRDLVDVPADRLHRRFLGWAR